MGQFIADTDFERVDFSCERPEHTEYELCVFRGCNFAVADLAGLSFMECRFVECDLSLVKLGGTALREASFEGCKMLGIHFDDCNKIGFGAAFDNCLLDHSTFTEMDLRQCRFNRCRLKGADFSNCNLTSVIFAECDLLNADFGMANLSKADLSTAANYSIDPEHTLIKGAKFALSGLPGLLEKYNIKVI